jgi:hypothetical protein
MPPQQLPRPPFFFQTPNTPDLGCFVRQMHGFQVDGDFPFWNEYAPGQAHQAYFRVKCGRASFHQMVKVWHRNFDGDVHSGNHPDWVLGGDFQPYPSEWLKFAPTTSSLPYWFRGEHRNPSQPNWAPDAAAGHSFDIYDNGTMSTVGWDDTGGDRDFDDMVVEVAIVFRRAYFDQLHPVAKLQQAEFDRFVREELPKLSRAKDHSGHKAGDS